MAGARSTGAFRVNAAGQVAGYTSSTRPDPDLESTGYVWTAGEVATVSFPGAAQTQVFGLGDGGAVLGRFGADLRHQQRGPDRGFLRPGPGLVIAQFP